MRKRQKRNKLNRDVAHRKALLKNLSQELIRYGKIRTTLAKAKVLRSFVEPLITKSRKGEAAQRLVAKALYDQEIVKKLINEVGPGYEKSQRPGGYVRIVKVGPRQGDGVEEAIIELVD